MYVRCMSRIKYRLQCTFCIILIMVDLSIIILLFNKWRFMFQLEVLETERIQSFSIREGQNLKLPPPLPLPRAGYEKSATHFMLFNEPAVAVFLISIAYQTIANRRLDLVRLCPNLLKSIVYQVDQIDYCFQAIWAEPHQIQSSISNSLIGD